MKKGAGGSWASVQLLESVFGIKNKDWRLYRPALSFAKNLIDRLN